MFHRHAIVCLFVCSCVRPFIIYIMINIVSWALKMCEWQGRVDLTCRRPEVGCSDVRMSGCPDIPTFPRLDIRKSAWMSGRPVIQTSRRPDMRSTDVKLDVYFNSICIKKYLEVWSECESCFRCFQTFSSFSGCMQTCVESLGPFRMQSPKQIETAKETIY